MWRVQPGGTRQRAAGGHGGQRGGAASAPSHGCTHPPPPARPAPPPARAARQPPRARSRNGCRHTLSAGRGRGARAQREAAAGSALARNRCRLPPPPHAKRLPGTRRGRATAARRWPLQHPPLPSTCSLPRAARQPARTLAGRGARASRGRRRPTRVAAFARSPTARPAPAPCPAPRPSRSLPCNVTRAGHPLEAGKARLGAIWWRGDAPCGSGRVLRPALSAVHTLGKWADILCGQGAPRVLSAYCERAAARLRGATRACSLHSSAPPPPKQF